MFLFKAMKSLLHDSLSGYAGVGCPGFHVEQGRFCHVVPDRTSSHLTFCHQQYMGTWSKARAALSERARAALGLNFLIWDFFSPFSCCSFSDLPWRFLQFVLSFHVKQVLSGFDFQPHITYHVWFSLTKPYAGCILSLQERLSVTSHSSSRLYVVGEKGMQTWKYCVQLWSLLCEKDVDRLERVQSHLVPRLMAIPSLLDFSSSPGYI